MVLQLVQPLFLHRVGVFVVDALCGHRGLEELPPEVAVLVIADGPGLHHVVALFGHKVLHRYQKQLKGTEGRQQVKNQSPY